MKKSKNNSLIAIILVAVLVIFGAGVYFYSNFQKNNNLSKEGQDALVRDHSPVVGNPDAKITIVEFMNPSCGVCIYFSPIVENLMTKYDGKVKVVYRFLQFNNSSDIILSLVKAANEQGKFKEALKLFFTQYNRWYVNHQVNPFVAWGILQEAGVDIERAQKYLDENADLIKEEFEQDKADALTLGVTGTPTFYINGKRPEKLSQDGSELTRLIESEIKRVY